MINVSFFFTFNIEKITIDTLISFHFQNEEKYLKQINTETERVQHRLLNVERIFATLKEDEKKYMIDIKGEFYFMNSHFEIL